MSARADQDPARARVALAVAQARRDWEAVIAHQDRAESVGPTGPAEAALVAMSLHHAYQAFESLLERLARLFDLPIPAGSRSHQQLLDDATIDVPGVRPALLGPDAARSWQELLRFRHFFRHAYCVELDPTELRKVRSHLADAVAGTRGHVSGLLAAVEGSGGEAVDPGGEGL